jgi:predicted transcriptional regulator
MSHLVGFTAILTYVTIGGILLRFRRNFSPIVLILLASIPIYLIYPIFIDDLEIIHYTGTYFFGAMMFLFFWGGLYKSISVRILCDLISESGGFLSVEHIYKKYLLTDSFKGRLEILLDSNLLLLRNDATYQLTLKGRKFVQRVRILQKIYKINASG